MNCLIGEENTVQEAHAICRMGSLHYRHSHFEKGLECAFRALSIGQSHADTVLIIKALRLFADNYYAQGKYEQSTDYFLQELECHRQTGADTQKVAEIYCNIGVNYEERGLLEKGLFYYIEALKLYEMADDKEGIVASLCNLSFVYRSQGDNEEAIEMLERANRIEKQYLELKKEHYFMVNIADAYKNMGNYLKASAYLLRADTMLQAISSPDDEDLMIWIDVAKNQADMFLIAGESEKAFTKYSEALYLSRKTGYKEKEAKVLVALGLMSMKSGNNSAAKSYLSEGRSIAENIGSFYLKKDIYNALSELAALQQNYRKAWEFEKLHNEASDSVINMESTRQLANFQAKYETEKKESQIGLLKKEREVRELQLQKSESQRTFLILIALLLLALSVIILNRFRLKRRSAVELALLNATKDKFFAIIAHDLKNPVSAFNSIAQQVNLHMESLSTIELKYYLTQLSDASSTLLSLLKNLLEWSRSQRGQLNPDLKAFNPTPIIKHAISEVSSLAEAKRIEFRVSTTDGVSIFSDWNILNTVLRNLLGNAIKYSPEESIVDVQTKIRSGEFIVSITDQGPGLSGEEIKKLFRIEVDTKTIGTPENKGSGIGLIICYEFLQKIGGRIWAESPEDKGCAFCVAIPLDKQQSYPAKK